MSLGRPSKYKPEYCESLIEHMAQGQSYASFAADVDVAVDTLYEWENAHEEFSEAKKIAWAKSLKYWETVGLNGLLDPAAINNTLWIFTMKCRFRKLGWNDQPEQEKSEEQNLSEDIKVVADWLRNERTK